MRNYFNIQKLFLHARPHTLNVGIYFDADAEDSDGAACPMYTAYILDVDSKNRFDAFQDLVYADRNIELAMGGLDEAVEHWIMDLGLKAIEVMHK